MSVDSRDRPGMLSPGPEGILDPASVFLGVVSRPERVVRRGMGWKLMDIAFARWREVTLPLNGIFQYSVWADAHPRDHEPVGWMSSRWGVDPVGHPAWRVADGVADEIVDVDE